MNKNLDGSFMQIYVSGKTGGFFKKATGRLYKGNNWTQLASTALK
jgi:hypothetical protein